MPELILTRYDDHGHILRTQLYANRKGYYAWGPLTDFGNPQLNYLNPTRLTLVAQRTFTFRTFNDFLKVFGTTDSYRRLYDGTDTVDTVCGRMTYWGIVECPIPTALAHA